MVQAYWQVGDLIVEHEHGAKRCAQCGEALPGDLSRHLTGKYGRGYATTNLHYVRQFCLAFPIHHAVRDEWVHGRKRNAMRSDTSVTRGRQPHHRADSVLEEERGSGEVLGAFREQANFRCKVPDYLPAEKELQHELLRERRLIEARRKTDEEGT